MGSREPVNVFQGLRMGSWRTLRNEMSEETPVLTQSKRLDWEGVLVPVRGEQQGEGTQETCSAGWLTVSGFMGMGTVSGWSLASRPAWSLLGLGLAQCPSWQHTHFSAKMDSSAKDPGKVAVSSLLWAPPQPSS